MDYQKYIRNKQSFWSVAVFDNKAYCQTNDGN